MWLKLLPYIGMFVVFAGYTAVIDNRGYDRGQAAAEKTCSETTVPDAKAEVQARCDTLTKATKEENDALSHNLNRLRTTYDRLRQQKPVATCVPIASFSAGNARPDAAAEHIERVGVSTEWLDLAFYHAATDIERGESCQRQLKNIYILNGALPAEAK